MDLESFSIFEILRGTNKVYHLCIEWLVKDNLSEQDSECILHVTNLHLVSRDKAHLTDYR